MKAMKTMAAFAVTLLLVAVFSPQVKAQDPTKEKTVTIKTSMHCDACKKTIETGLTKEKGVKSVSADSKTKMVTVTYDESQTNEENLVKSIKDMGYQAKVTKTKNCDEAAKKNCGGC